MYAELLEMREEARWLSKDGTHAVEDMAEDGVPGDLETHWVALAPVPKGKRCLAITQTQHVGQCEFYSEGPVNLAHLTLLFLDF